MKKSYEEFKNNKFDIIKRDLQENTDYYIEIIKNNDDINSTYSNLIRLSDNIIDDIKEEYDVEFLRGVNGDTEEGHYIYFGNDILDISYHEEIIINFKDATWRAAEKTSFERFIEIILFSRPAKVYFSPEENYLENYNNLSDEIKLFLEIEYPELVSYIEKGEI